MKREIPTLRKRLMQNTRGLFTQARWKEINKRLETQEISPKTP